MSPQVNTSHGKFHYLDNDMVGQTIASNQFWDAHFRPWLDRLTPGQVMVDVGANIGFFTVYLALRGVKVVAFEPCPEIYSILQANIELNGIGDLVEAHNVALYDRAVTMTVNPEWGPPTSENGLVDYNRCSNAGGFSLVVGQGGPYQLEARTLDSFNLADVALIKTDAQGSDLCVLRGAKDLIHRCHPVLCYECEVGTNHMHGDSLVEYNDFGKEEGYLPQVVGGNPACGWYDFVAEAK